MQNDVEVWHKNLLTEEGTGVNIYETLKNLNNMIYKDRQDVIEYYQIILSKRIEGERDTYEVIHYGTLKGAMNVLRRKVEEVEYENKMLRENYKSPAKMNSHLDKSKIRVSDTIKQLARKNEEIDNLKREIERLRTATPINESRGMGGEMQGKIPENYLRDNLRQAQETIQRLEDIIRDLETTLSNNMREARMNEEALRRQIDELRSKPSGKKELLEQRAEYELLLQEKEEQRLKQKNEWGEVIFSKNM
jgi:DNA repair exonuclease SbcCD ATPase subunit